MADLTMVTISFAESIWILRAACVILSSSAVEVSRAGPDRESSSDPALAVSVVDLLLERERDRHIRLDVGRQERDGLQAETVRFHLPDLLVGVGLDIPERALHEDDLRMDDGLDVGDLCSRRAS